MVEDQDYDKSIVDEVINAKSIKVSDSIDFNASGIITSPGRMHFIGANDLFILNSGGVRIGNRDGGGNLTVDGTLTVVRNINVLFGDMNVSGSIGFKDGGIITSPGRMHFIGANDLFILNSGGVRISNRDGGGSLTVDENVYVRGDLTLENADCSEDFDIVGAESIEPGTVMVIDNDGALRASEKAYDKRVAGVISGAGDLRPGINLGRLNGQTNRLPLALTGKVYCKVDAEYSKIDVGDLLTTSSTIGHAMKVGDPVRSIGAIIGKALKPLKAGQDLIPILVALQ